MSAVRNILVVNLLIVCLHGYSQDVHFSMYDMSPLTLNAGNTGMMEGDKRLCNIYRTQWKAIAKPLQTFAVSYDQQIYALPKNISAGLLFISDKSGGIDLVENKFFLSAAIKMYRGMNVFSIGVQGGYVSKTLSLTGITFPEQYSRDIGAFDPNIFNGESNYEVTRGYLDLNAGLSWQKPTSHGVMRGGIGLLHINSPDDSFYRNGLGLKPRLSINAGYRYNLSDKWYIDPSVLLMTLQKAQDLVITPKAGINMAANPGNIRSVYFGLGVRTGISRNGDAAFPTAGIEFRHFNIAAAYDINFSELSVATNNRGAFEIALIYNGRSTAISKVTLPCDRY